MNTTLKNFGSIAMVALFALVVAFGMFSYANAATGGGSGAGGGCCGGSSHEGGSMRDRYTYNTPTRPTCSIYANPSAVAYGGSATVTWSTSNASSVSISSWGQVSLSGSRTISNLTSDKSYVLTANGAGGLVTCSTNISVQAQPTPVCPSGTTGTYPNCVTPTPSCPAGSTGNFPVCIANTVTCPSGTISAGNNICIVNNNNNVNNNVVTVNVPAQQQPVYNTPSCTMQLSQNYVSYGQPVTLSWYSQNATSGYINNGIGNVALSGSRTVYPYSATTYTGTFYGQNGQQINCSATVNADNYQPTQTPYVTLSQVPYTGLDLGPVGTALYWAFLVAWCVFAAYLIAIKRVHMSIYRWYNGMLFSTDTTAHTAVGHTAVSAAASAPVAHDAIDPFVLSQINRAN